MEGSQEPRMVVFRYRAMEWPIEARPMDCTDDIGDYITVMYASKHTVDGRWEGTHRWALDQCSCCGNNYWGVRIDNDLIFCANCMEGNLYYACFGYKGDTLPVKFISVCFRWPNKKVKSARNKQ